MTVEAAPTSEVHTAAAPPQPPRSQTESPQAEKVYENEEGTSSSAKGNEFDGVKKVRDLPQLEVYFKMLRLGVPLQAVKLKMSREGFDPELMEDPEAAAPEAMLVEAERFKTDNSDSTSSATASEAEFSD